MTVLRTARLVLRPFEAADLAPYIAIRAKREVGRFLPAVPKGDRENWGKGLFALFDAAWRERGYGPWAATDAASGRLLGHLGLRHLPEFGETELLYALDVDAWGQGLATEGAAAALRFGFETVGLARIMAIAIPENAASRKVMTKLGLSYERMASFKGFDVAYHALDRAAWRG
jgi:ribosomal-protein-alanine N-acetyltransferase